MQAIENLSCNAKLIERIRQNLTCFETNAQNWPGVRQAAVAITIVPFRGDAGVYGMDTTSISDDQAALILTLRNSALNHHAGQWAFPGGRLDAGETPEEAALRELSEEVGLVCTEEQILGRLDDFITHSGFVITPIVIWGGDKVKLAPNPAEVKSVHRIPVKEFLREDSPLLEASPDSENSVLLMPVGDSWIATPTGAILYQFREVAVLGEKTRVSQYVEPLFARR